MGRPAYELVNDSNLDWNQALPDVEQWVQGHGLERVVIDEYGFSDPAVYVPQAQLWDCQQPTAADADSWVVVSASMIADGHNCLWLFQYPYQTLAGGAMYAFRLPAVLPPAGAAGGPPLPESRHNFAGIPFQEDIRVVNLRCIRDPSQLQPTMDRMWAMYEAAHPKKK